MILFYLCCIDACHFLAVSWTCCVVLACAPLKSMRIKDNIILISYKSHFTNACTMFFVSVRGSNHGPCIYYVLSLLTELSSRGPNVYTIT